MSQGVTIGNEVPREGCIHENGWLICDYGEANLREVYLKHRDLIGDPISSFDSRCQTFTFTRLCYDRGKPDGWKVEFDNLGLRDLRANGFTPQPGAAPHPAVRDWLQWQVDLGLDVQRVIGPLISQPICDRSTELCYQVADKAKFVFRQDATSGTEVQRVPLGLQLPAAIPAALQPTVVATATTEPAATVESAASPGAFNPVLLVLAALVLLAAIGALVAKSSSGAGSGPRTN
jgi:hypothetical protein